MYPTPLPPCSPEELDLSTVPTALKEILNRLLEAYACAGVVPPSNKYWGVGIPSGECDSLVVTGTDIVPDNGDDTTPNCQTTLRLSVRISVTRCVPVANASGTRPPTPHQWATAGNTVGTDAWLLIKSAHLLDLYQMGGLDTDLVINPPEGGMQIVDLTFSIVV